MLKRLLLIACLTVSVSMQARNADGRIGLLINESNWFGLEQELKNTPADSLSPFLRQLAEAMTHHYFNRPDSACMAFAELLNNYPQELGEQAMNMLVLLSMNLARTGDFAGAAALVQDLCDRLASVGVDSTQLVPYRMQIQQYRALAACAPVCQPLHKADEYHIPMTVVNKSGQHSVEIDGSINGKEGRLLFDTGAGGNMITPGLAEKYGLRFLDADITVGGFGGTKQGGYAVADTLRIGGMTWINVPFAVVDIRTGHEEADRIALEHELPPVIGLPVMFSMQEIRMDFARNEIVIPETPSPNPLAASNLLRTETEGLRLKAEDETGNPLYLHFDTGTYFTFMQPSWYSRHRSEVASKGIPDSLRLAGVGGVSVTRTYRLPEMKFGIGNGTVTVGSVNVNTGIDLHSGQMKDAAFTDGTEDGVLGLNALEKFSEVIINFKDMYMEAVPYPCP